MPSALARVLLAIRQCDCPSSTDAGRRVVCCTSRQGGTTVAWHMLNTAPPTTRGRYPEATRQAEHRSPPAVDPLGGWADPAGLCTAMLRRATLITCRFGRMACDLARANDTWQVLDQAGDMIAEAPVVIIAAAYESHLDGAVAAPPLVRVRGQVSHLPPADSRRLRIVVCGDGYVAPLPSGGHCVGATFQPDESDEVPPRRSCAKPGDPAHAGFGCGRPVTLADAHRCARQRRINLPAAGQAVAPLTRRRTLYRHWTRSAWTDLGAAVCGGTCGESGRRTSPSVA
jgi:hypothetical protein